MVSVDSGACVDRITSLPSDIIAHILSFLETKEVFATSILSSRWKLAWTFVPNLLFEDEDFSSKKHFISFVDRVLSLHTTSRLRRLEISCEETYDVSHVRKWFSAALMCNVEDLSLFVPTGDTSEALYLDSSSCQKLVELALGSHFVLDIPTLVWLPNLKYLSLNKLKFLDDDSIKRLLGGCPMLEELNFITGMTHDLNITSPVLRRLEVYLSHPKHKIVIDAPALQYLAFNGYAPTCCVIYNLNQLMEADLFLDEFSLPLTEMEFQAVTHLFLATVQVRTLFLTYHIILAIIMGCSELPMFNNLTSLSLMVELSHEMGWALLPDLLEHSPLLEKLIFTSLIWGEESTYIRQNPMHWIAPRHVPSCLLSSLKHIKIENFKGSKQEKKMADYFLKNGEVLEEITFSSSHHSNTSIAEYSRDGKGRRARRTSDEDLLKV